jgi:voltage-gated potassium channel Kch
MKKLQLVFAGRNYAVRYAGDDPAVIAILRTLDVRVNPRIAAEIRAALPHIPHDPPPVGVQVVLSPRPTVSRAAATAIAAAVGLELTDETGGI